MSPADKDSTGQPSDGERERFPALPALSGRTADESSKQGTLSRRAACEGERYQASLSHCRV